MAFSHGIDADFSFAGSTKKAYCEMMDCTLDRDVDDIKVLGSDWVQHVTGCRAMRITVNGPWDATMDAAAFTAFDSDAVTAFVATPQAGVTYSGNCRVTSYKPGPTGSAGKAAWSMELVSDGTVTRA